MSSARPSFFWHDYETSGTDSARDRIWQFAGQRTDAALRPLGEPVNLYCQPARDNLPQPDACMITGLVPQELVRTGLPEPEFAARVHEALARPGTCGVGYNSLRFDDHFTRHLLYRNFHDPYAREWQHGNSRWDIIDLARMAHALRPQGIEWPRREDGSPSFRLEDLARANHLPQSRAHDALADVEATIALARLLRQRQPRLWDWYFALRSKRHAESQLDVPRRTPVVHVSSRYPAARGCLAVVAPLAQHPQRKNEIIVFDLDADPTELLTLPPDAIADRVFTPRADLPEDVERIPLRTIRLNQSPALAPLSVLRGVDHARIGLDLDRCLRHAARIRAVPEVAATARSVYADAPAPDPAADPELALYGAFLPEADRARLDAVRSSPPEALAAAGAGFRDARYPELLFRYRARNWPQTLDASERARWDAWVRRRLGEPTETTSITLADYLARITALRAQPEAPVPLLDHLEAWGRELAAEHDVPLPPAS